MARKLGSTALDQEKVAFFLAEAGHLPVHVMAEITETSEGAIYRLLHRHRKRLILNYSKPAKPNRTYKRSSSYVSITKNNAS